MVLLDGDKAADGPSKVVRRKSNLNKKSSQQKRENEDERSSDDKCPAPSQVYEKKKESFRGTQDLSLGSCFL